MVIGSHLAMLPERCPSCGRSVGPRACTTSEASARSNRILAVMHTHDRRSRQVKSAPPKAVGQTVPEPLRERLAPRFGFDFTNVRIHADENAARAADAAG